MANWNASISQDHKGQAHETGGRKIMEDKLKSLGKDHFKEKEVTISAELLFDLIEVCNWYQSLYAPHETSKKENTTAFVKAEAISFLLPLTRDETPET